MVSKNVRPKLYHRQSRLWISMRDVTTFGPNVLIDIWKSILAVSALFDFLSIYLPEWLLRNDLDEFDEVEKKAEGVLFFWKKDLDDNYVEENDLYLNVARWFDDNSILLSIIFCLLYLVDAFVQANRRRIKVLRKRDKKRLLETDIGADPSKGEDESWDTGGWGVYTNFVTIQLLLLPVGFFVLLARYSRSIFTNETIEFNKDSESIEIANCKSDDEGIGIPDFREAINDNPTRAVIFTITGYCVYVTQIILQTSFKDLLRRFTLRISRRTAVFAIRNPRKFRRRLIVVLAGVRWLKYLAPLIGACNKLKGNLADLIKKFRQKREAIVASLIRKKVWYEMTVDERRERAALIIQSKFRSVKVQQHIRALKIFQGNKETLAAIKMQKALRRLLARARANLKAKKKELRKLHQEMKLKQKKNEYMSVEHRRRMYELQDELGVEAKKLLNRNMLLRPNTWFAVTWKIIFVVAVIFEISQLALKPHLAKYKDEITGKPLDIEHILEHHLVPTPFTELKECNALAVEEEPRSRVSKILNGLRLFRKQQGAYMEALTPWYCGPPISTIQSVYIFLLNCIIFKFLEITAFICFMDVFITFFTGELDTRGVLVPKPFFTRWILPGLFLQLLVNPQMETVSFWTFRGIHNILFVGPIRFVRWVRCLFYPLLFIVYRSWERLVWIPLVHGQNTNRLLKSKL